jgi:predicted nucleic acid-binding protein
VVVCDASPLIFLAKLNRLELIEQVSGREPVVLRCVKEEVLSDRASPVERERLENWFSGVRLIDYSGSLFASNALSRSDQSSLAWAVENQAEWLLADERLLRQFAKEYGVRVIGFCGLLLQAVRLRHLRAEKARQLIDVAVRDHGFRISIELYQRIQRELRV